MINEDELMEYLPMYSASIADQDNTQLLAELMSELYGYRDFTKPIHVSLNTTPINVIDTRVVDSGIECTDIHFKEYFIAWQDFESSTGIDVAELMDMSNYNVEKFKRLASKYLSIGGRVITL